MFEMDRTDRALTFSDGRGVLARVVIAHETEKGIQLLVPECWEVDLARVLTLAELDGLHSALFEAANESV